MNFDQLDRPSGSPERCLEHYGGQCDGLQVNIAGAKAKLSSLLDRALAGEEIVIARAGKPLARLTPVECMTRPKPGAWRGLKIPNDALFEPMDLEDLDAAEGKHTDEFGITPPRSSEP